MSGAALYTPEVLAAAVSLAGFPLDNALPLLGEARSRTCGSSLALRLGTDAQGRIVAAGCSAKACAIGQAAAALFLGSAVGKGRAGIAEARGELAQWLASDGDLTECSLPDWPGIALLEPARRHAGRHAAILLAWDAALAALDGEPTVAGLPSAGSATYGTPSEASAG
jgi:NifU-like protein involved in Fe-S cluster formation